MDPVLIWMTIKLMQVPILALFTVNLSTTKNSVINSGYAMIFIRPLLSGARLFAANLTAFNDSLIIPCLIILLPSSRNDQYPDRYNIYPDPIIVPTSKITISC